MGDSGGSNVDKDAITEDVPVRLTNSMPNQQTLAKELGTIIEEDQSDVTSHRASLFVKEVQQK